MDATSLASSHVTPNLPFRLIGKHVRENLTVLRSSGLPPLFSLSRCSGEGLVLKYGTNFSSDHFRQSQRKNLHTKLQSTAIAPVELEEENLTAAAAADEDHKIETTERNLYRERPTAPLKVEQVLHMMGGTGATSYSKNSKIQAEGILRVKPTVEEAIRDVYNNLLPKKLVVADLGCSTGPNTFLVVSMIAGAVTELCRRRGFRLPDIQFFLNDLPGNDFNNIFQFLMSFQEQVREVKGDNFVPFYVSGLPGSFYQRLFPDKSVHFFHSSYCQMWLSQVPRGLAQCEKVVPMEREKLYLEQFQEDFSLFLKQRSKELIFGGRMVLTFAGKRNYPNGEDMDYIWGLLTEAFNDMVSEGLLNKASGSALDFPFYMPKMDELKTIIDTEGSFVLDQVQIFKLDWDPFDNFAKEFAVDSIKSGEIVAKYIRATVEPILSRHFDNEVLEELFSRYAKVIGKHLSMCKAKFINFLLVLKLKG